MTLYIRFFTCTPVGYQITLRSPRCVQKACEHFRSSKPHSGTLCTVLSTPVKLVLYFILYFRSYSNVKIYLLLFFNTSHYNIIYLHIIHGKANKSTSILIQMPFLFWIFSYLSKIYTQSNIHWIYTLTHDTQWRAFSVFIIIMLS